MALKKPLVMGSGGRPQVLQSGDSIDIGGDDFVQTNGESSVAITLGQPVYVSGADTVKRAQANTQATAEAVGLVSSASIAAGATGSIRYAGVLSVPDWTAVVGATVLTVGANYFLDPTTPGKLTATPPTAAGQYVVEVGRAIATTELLIRPQPSIAL